MTLLQVGAEPYEQAQIGDPDQFDACIVVFGLTVMVVTLYALIERLFSKKRPPT